MALSDSPIDPRPLQRAKALLAQTERSESVAPVAAAAVLFAVSALALAVTVVTIPPHWSN
jgi:hypothetical protein